MAEKKEKEGTNAKDNKWRDLLGFPATRYPRGFPRAEWDTYPDTKGSGCTSYYNYRTKDHEWSRMPLAEAPDDVQRDYHPEGLTIAEDRERCAARRAARGELPYPLPPGMAAPQVTRITPNGTTLFALPPLAVEE